MVTALLTAAGIGSRMGQEIPKQFIHIDNKPIIIYTMEAFQKHPAIDSILVVTLPEWMDVLKAYARQFRITKLRWVIPGGKTGQESISLGIKELRKHLKDDDIVMIHDGNRCLVSNEIISNSLAVYKKYGSAVAAIPCVEAVFKSEDQGLSSLVSISREKLFRTQTPHTYAMGKIFAAYSLADTKGIKNTTAACILMQQLGERVYFSKGSELNLKITTPEDLIIFEALLHTRKAEWIK